jgi:hypothetical protein
MLRAYPSHWIRYLQIDFWLVTTTQNYISCLFHISRMPVYLLHGFRWPREGLTGIRVRTVLQDLEDVSADYIQTTSSQSALLESFRSEYPDVMKNLPNLILLEQYDPEDVSSDAAICQPYAFVGDRVVTIAGGGPNTIQRPLSGVIQDSTKMPATHGAKKSTSGEVQGKAMSPSPRSRDTALSVNIEDVMASGPGVTPQAWEALADLRDKIATGEKIGWFVVFNGDPDRLIDHDEDDDDSEEDQITRDESMAKHQMDPSDGSKPLSTTTTNSSGKRGVATTSMPIREKGKQKPTMNASTEKSLPAAPPKEKMGSKSDAVKKFFGKREKSRG